MLIDEEKIFQSSSDIKDYLLTGYLHKFLRNKNLLNLGNFCSIGILLIFHLQEM